MKLLNQLLPWSEKVTPKDLQQTIHLQKFLSVLAFVAVFCLFWYGVPAAEKYFGMETEPRSMFSIFSAVSFAISAAVIVYDFYQERARFLALRMIMTK